MQYPDSSCCSIFRVIVLLGLMPLWACGDDGGAHADAGPPTIEIGGGDREFEALTNGDTILIVQGPQDGYHFFGSVVATNINAGDSRNLASAQNPTTTFEVFVGADRVDALASSYTQGLKITDMGPR